MKNNGIFGGDHCRTDAVSRHAIKVFVLLLAALSIIGCEGTVPNPQFARKGDTVFVAIDRQPTVSREDLTVRFIDHNGYSQDIPGTDPSVRALINVYPEPVSKLVVGYETRQGLGVGAISWGNAATFQSEGTRNWFDSFLIVDIPTDVATGGELTIDVLVGGLSILQQVNTMYIVADDVVPGQTGSPNLFENFENGSLQENQLRMMERADHYTVSFSGPVVPATIDFTVAHAPDKDNAGTGQAYVSHYRSDLTAINWTDDGYNLHVIAMPMWLKTPEDQAAINIDPEMSWFDFFIAGGLTGLQTPVVTGYDENGVPLTGNDAVSVTIQ